MLDCFIFFTLGKLETLLVDLMVLGITKQTNRKESLALTVKLSKHDKEITRVGSYICTVKVSS